MSDADSLLETAVQAARMAGGLLLERVRRGTERGVAAKSTPTDLVSEADLASQRAIRELLAEHRPDDGFVGEEESASSDGTSGLRWVVDPLDGTINFIFGIPQWCVSVAVRDGQGTVAGAIFDPNRNELFTTTREGRPRMIGPAGASELAGPQGQHRAAAAGGDGLATALVATGFAYDAAVRAEQAGAVGRLLPVVRDIRRCGSAALDLAWTAAGRYDAYFERAVEPWDIAAGVLLCERAGLQVRQLPARDGLPWGVLVAPGALADALLALVEGT